ncbi:uroporphyrinogen-III C-methyltransferase [Reichenbachiella agarivorans]|uniref:uroporphyrinogen-III C-methyltransferase n=1 Tax=Reichenbachiella agarivorans TaxID=2979464 RepID=A0ABY6CS22_9BACT|nr:uroporphyrinogen-III C-methyltransferase [Reichenbachiella agarivorans]UXP33321.1 uroporphyrinogen-III C-methyltransferase [Reichenbachiella agarivorans]
MPRKAKLTLVGAGPGDPELITLKGIRALKDADVVLYDALANEELLAYCKESAIKTFVGKRAGFHVYQQDQINEAIVSEAKAHGHVVRLKGGDPYVFGRGHEELEYAEAHGLEVELIPGITSAISVPALNQIPLTRRGYNESFWVLTAVKSDGSLAADLELATQSTATVVILMGMKKLPAILDVFIKHGKKDTPAAVIQNGSRPDKKIVIGKVDTLAQLVLDNDLQSPAIIVIGQTVHLGEAKLKKEMETLDLSQR